MKIFNNLKLKVGIVALVLAFGFVSCESELDKQPVTELTEGQAFADPEAYTEFLARVYAGFAVSGQEGPAGNPDIQGIDEGFSNYLRQFWKHQELNTDEAIIAWNDGTIHDLHNHVWTPSNEFIRAMYDRIYFQIGIANQFLRETTDEKLDGRGVDSALKAEIQTFRAEARFLRALSYWHAIDFYGNIAFVTEEDPVGNFFPEQKSRDFVFDWLISELNEIEPAMVGARQNEYGRADQATVWMLLAKLYLNADVYINESKASEAMANINKVIGAGYTLHDTYTELFLADNDVNGSQNEIIFPIQFDGINTTGYGGTTFLTHAPVGGKMNAADFGINGGWGGIRTTKNFVFQFGDLDTDALNEAIGPESKWGLVGSATPNGWGDGPDMVMHESATDQYAIYANLVAGEIKFRFDNDWGLNLGDNGADGSLEEGGANIAIANDGAYYITLDRTDNTYTITETGDGRANFFTEDQTLEIEDPFNFSNGYAVEKFKNIDVNGNQGSDGSGDFVDVDFPMFRLADAYLMYAEAFLRGGGGSASEAAEYVNMLRERAYGSAAGNIDATDLTLEFILDERSRELHWEGHRRTDLVRFNQFTENGVWPWKGGIMEGKTTEKWRDVYPIPSADIIANPGLKQNDGY
ncbi:RagB/SusD family nutrient uptake outer membrane protein [Lutimonas zeaxanthinifaciens]|uniref:RagB/SusD family nutrient uptake outer membrane protein n=1 Tax=Lutimonas zeaxanthinifaciens TaxID=3060215 RepID=UPI003D1840E2